MPTRRKKTSRHYGNHASVSIDPAKTQAAFVKDNKRSFNLIMDIRLVPFLLNTPLTPQGMVNISKPNKKDRPVFDSTFRPRHHTPWRSTTGLTNATNHH
jgi:hypothetical protein